MNDEKYVPLETENDREAVRTITVLVVEPVQPCRVQEIPNTLEAMQQIVGGYIESVSFEREAIICNEEGKLLGLPYNRPLMGESGLPIDILQGTFLIAGINGEHFASLTDKQIQKYRELYDNGMVITAVKDRPHREKSGQKKKGGESR